MGFNKKQIANCDSNLPYGSQGGALGERVAENAEGGWSEGKAFPSFIIKIHVYIPAVMEHVELAGIHSGDSACVIPPVSIPEDNLKTIKEYTTKIAQALKVTGLMNMQYAIENGKVYVIEANVVR